MNKAYIGIDPGKTGFISVIDESGVIIYYPIPRIGIQVDMNKLNLVFNEIKQNFGDLHCAIEDVHAVFGSSAKSTFNFGHIVGALEAMLVSHSIPFTKIQPKIWQKQMWVGISIQKVPSSTGKTMKTDTKKMSLLAAKRLFPNEDLRKSIRASKEDHNKVDSLLIAEYCRRNF